MFKRPSTDLQYHNQIDKPQINIYYGGKLCTNGSAKIVYPTTHSIPGPYLQSYINLPRRTYMY